MVEAWLYDGERALRHPVTVERRQDELAIRFEDGDMLMLAPAQLCHIESRSGHEVYGRHAMEGWRLGIPAAEVSPLAAVLPPRQRYGRLIDRIGLGPAVAAGVAISAAVLLAALNFPKLLAPHIPAAWEKSYGDALVGDFGGKYCSGAGGQAALNKLARRLSPDSEKLNIRVVNIDLVNAAALPGGNIVLFEKLLADAKGPDEVAGVLAHEISHVERRHVTQAMIRDLGLGLVVSAFGGTTGGSIDGLLSAGHSRGAEREADADAVAGLRRARISPVATAGFFERMAKQEERFGRVATGLSYISTHPMSAERQKAFRGSAVPGAAYTPALTGEEWQALSRICVNHRKTAPAI